VFALLGLAWRSPAGTRVAGGLALLLATAGLGAALWQYFVAARSASCNLTLADRIVNATGLNALHRSGLLYQRRFDTSPADNSHYDLKLGYASSHSYAIDAVPQAMLVCETIRLPSM